ncbi:hypothetical protein LLE49_06290 [Alicyclobacillus tolerans]|uniref:hypothetical protein n=1 Tax=Alicyclobacillus tolerans TaxID=90970 RepID=UPI001F2A9AE9|nr:hypothetical protein [Alicyclobacillus tolerans]MCF8564353.1 hypothetical protein [Alicyclobacillus tolerans]
MKTLRGFDAIEMADRFHLLLTNQKSGAEVTAEKAMELVTAGVSADGFVIANWPDTEEEAESIVLAQFAQALKATLMATARISEIVSPERLHVEAAELAARRLVAKGQLELVETNRGYSVYRLPKTVRLTEKFIDKLGTAVCEECADLDFSTAFHPECIENLYDFLLHGDFEVDEITEVIPVLTSAGASRRLGKPSSGLEWLTHTASVTKNRWKNALKPLFVQEDGTQGSVKDAPLPGTSEELRTESLEAAGRQDELNLDTDETQRPRITKQELIQYLSSVEIVDNNREVGLLRREREELLAQIAAKEQDIQKLEKQRSFMEKQCDELQRDVETLVQAMKIAKRHEPKSAQVIDATYESK